MSLTVQIVSAHVANTKIPAEQLPALIRGVHQALTTVDQASREPTMPAPAVSVKKSVFADRILCLDCGGGFKMLKRHILADHEMTPQAYRAKWGLPPSYPMVAADHAANRSKLAKASGLGLKRKGAAAPRRSGRSKD